MFCPNCGTQLPDGTQFCSECGVATAVQPEPAAKAVDLNKVEQSVPQPAQSIPQPVQSMEQPAQSIPQPTQSFGALVQPAYQQPMFNEQPQQFGAQQPGYAAPVYGQATAVKKKPPIVPIIIGVCSAALVAFLIVLFTVIIPNNSGIRGKLRHKWTTSESGISVTYDLKKNQATTFGISFPITWTVSGEDHLKVEMSFMGETNSDEYIFSLSEDGKTLTLSNVNRPSQKTTWTRAD